MHAKSASFLVILHLASIAELKRSSWRM